MKTLITTLLFASAVAASAATTMVSFSPNLMIPDNSSVGVADFRMVSTPITSIASVEVSIGINGGFNGDYYAYLQHETGFAVLMNRPGRTSANDFGFADSGVTVTYQMPATNDFHLYQNVNNPGGAAITGVYAVDGRNVDPLVATDTTPRTATLDSFQGLNPNGRWALFVADRSSGGIGTFDNWSLTITGIPEPSSALMLLSALAITLRRRR